MLVVKRMSHTDPLPYEPCDWATGTNAEIVEALQKHYKGDVDLHKYWSVGEERIVSLSAMSATSVGESHRAQDISLVIMNHGGKLLEDNETECAFIVGLKNVLIDSSGSAENGYMNPSGQSYYENGWDGSVRRTWCNEVFKNAFPDTVDIFKKFKNISDSGYSNPFPHIQKVSYDYFALPAEYEVFGNYTNSNSTSESGLIQFEYYKTTANQVKYRGLEFNIPVYWWLRSFDKNRLDSYCQVSSTRFSDTELETNVCALSPFGVI